MWSIALFSVVLTSFQSASMAQNYGAEPVYGHVQLASPLESGPLRIAVSAGGHVNARELNFHATCRGFFNPEAPQIKLNYQASGAAFQIYAHSAADTTLIVRDPSGAWHCNDDTYAKNPSVRFSSPKSGEYTVWVGAFGGGRPQADLYMTEP